jgi:gamma-glutamylcyclotransferase (GGCT)/AIG2-like uncharacterized protein YtfP
MQKQVKIFVYGTLKHDGPLGKQVKEEKLIKYIKACTTGTLYKIGFFPGAIFSGKSTIKGELHTYKDKKEVLYIFDDIEGYFGKNNKANLFNREKIEVTDENGKRHKCYAYAYARNTSILSPIKDGVWRN